MPEHKEEAAADAEVDDTDADDAIETASESGDIVGAADPAAEVEVAPADEEDDEEEEGADHLYEAAMTEEDRDRRGAIAAAAPEFYREIVVVPPEERVTSDFFTQYEYTAVLSLRAQHIADGAPIYVTDSAGTPEEIAAREIEQRRCPLNIERVIGKNKKEIWSCRELTVMSDVRSDC